MYTLKLAIKSLLNRRLTTVLTIASIALSIGLLFGVERVRLGARESFQGTISKTDLIVGARGGSIQLLLYAVFRMGSASNNLSWETYQAIKSMPEVAWTIPYSLGDSHRGFRVVGTTGDFYERYRYRGDRGVEFSTGKAPSGLFDVALGAVVAEELGYRTGSRLTLSHGVSEVSFQNHDNMPFTVTGILAYTGTPIDRSVYITLEGMEALHVDWADGAPPLPENATSAETLLSQKLEVHQITAFLLGATSRMETLSLQRKINEFEDEPVMAIIPGVALSELWDGIAYAEDGLRVVSAFVVVVGLLGMLVSLYNSLNERRREMAIFRSVGAGPRLIFSLLVIESFLITAAGLVAGLTTMYMTLIFMQPLLESLAGLHIPVRSPAVQEYVYIAVILGLGFLMGLVPALRAYRNTLTDGLTIRI